MAFVVVYAIGGLRAGSDTQRLTVSESDLVDQFGRAAPLNVSQNSNAGLISLYPARFVNPKYWDDPLSIGEDPFGLVDIPDGFIEIMGRPQDQIATELGLSADAPATAIRIPDIEIDSAVDALELIVEPNGVQRWDDPDQIVGHIPISGMPGGNRSGWYFGHLSSLGEGNVFADLPEVPDLVREDPVDIFITTAEAEFLYRVSATYEIDADDLQLDLYEPSLSVEEPAVYLCTCWPPNNYSRRVVVKASLVAIRTLA